MVKEYNLNIKIIGGFGMKKLIAIILPLILIMTGCSEIKGKEASIAESREVKKFYNYLEKTNTTGFVVMKDNKIVMEEYWNGGEDESGNIASAGKSICSVLVGIAMDKGYFKIDDKVSKYLGNGFSDMPKEMEDQITIENLLSMTSGLNDSLKMVSESGKGWEYSDCWNLLFNILEITTKKDINSFAKEELLDKIGMKDSYYKSSKTQLYLFRGKNKPTYKNWDPYQIYCSTRDMATFGQLILQKGSWNGEQIVSKEYLEKALKPSSNFNPAYGYLFWLNEMDNGLAPGSNKKLEKNIIPNAPKDLVAALGFGDKKIYIIPSMNMVIARSGKASTDKKYAFTSYDIELWEQLNILIQSVSKILNK